MTYTFTVDVLIVDSPMFTVFLVFFAIFLIYAIYKWIAALVVGG